MASPQEYKEQRAEDERRGLGSGAPCVGSVIEPEGNPMDCLYFALWFYYNLEWMVDFLGRGREGGFTVGIFYFPSFCFTFPFSTRLRDKRLCSYFLDTGQIYSSSFLPSLLPSLHPSLSLQPLNLKDGVTLRRRLPLDGTEGHAKLEVRANLCLPEPEIEYSTDKKRLIMGTGDIQLSIDELNLCLEY